jgi:hypothetical protein
MHDARPCHEVIEPYYIRFDSNRLAGEASVTASSRSLFPPQALATSHDRSPLPSDVVLYHLVVLMWMTLPLAATVRSNRLPLRFVFLAPVMSVWFGPLRMGLRR